MEAFQACKTSHSIPSDPVVLSENINKQQILTKLIQRVDGEAGRACGL